MQAATDLAKVSVKGDGRSGSPATADRCPSGDVHGFVYFCCAQKKEVGLTLVLGNFNGLPNIGVHASQEWARGSPGRARSQ